MADERERIFRCSMPKYTLVAPASMAAAKLSQHPTGAMISISGFCIGFVFMLQRYCFFARLQNISLKIPYPLPSTPYPLPCLCSRKPKNMQKNHFLFGRLKKKQYLCGRFRNYGTLPERLGIGLQNRGRRFESARYLKEEPLN